MTYGDGLADVDISSLVAFHERHGGLATVTVINPPGRFGSLTLDADRVTEVREKPEHGGTLINGGFFVLNPPALNLIDGDHTVWEREPMEALASKGELHAFRHDGFWQPMDTLRDKRHLEELWTAGRAPWKVWDR